MPTTSVWVTFTQAKKHCWPDAPDDGSHGHLRDIHRHLFHVRVEATVTDDDRELSFEHLRDEAEYHFDMYVPYTSDWSCERMASTLAECLRDDFPTLSAVTVSEDGESGATWRAE